MYTGIVCWVSKWDRGINVAKLLKRNIMDYGVADYFQLWNTLLVIGEYLSVEQSILNREDQYK